MSNPQKGVASLTHSNDSDELRGLIDRMLQSTDASTAHLKEEVFKSAESGVLHELMKSSGSSPSQIFEYVLPSLKTVESRDAVSMLLKSGESVKSEAFEAAFLTNFMSNADPIKSPDLVKSVSGMIKQVPNLSSTDWSMDVSQIDNDAVKKAFASQISSNPGILSRNSSLCGASPPPASAGAAKPRTNWYALYESATTTAHQAAEGLAGLKTTPAPPTKPKAVGPSQTKKKSSNKRARSSKPRNQEPEKKDYVDVTDQDVLCGRGGRVNHHPGNAIYQQEKDRIQKKYLAAEKHEKTVISQELVDYVHARGGRFLKQEPKKDLWYEILPKEARKKASQTLREINTPEVRAAKRARYAK